MAICDNIIGVRNIMLTFHDCDTDESIGPLKHELSGTDLPMWRNCAWTTEDLPGGYVKRTAASPTLTMNIVRDTRVPLAFYQGCATVDVQIEMWNGIVQTGKSGGVTGTDQSDLHEVAFNASFKLVDELLPAGGLASAS